MPMPKKRKIFKEMLDSPAVTRPKLRTVPSDGATTELAGSIGLTPSLSFLRKNSAKQE